ncbi:MAG: delta-aminolevulinic acid dehydratase [Snowella sp.]|nr:MAG: delta-aminolevulinic acid dehydratase [Snowella sp.]
MTLINTHSFNIIVLLFGTIFFGSMIIWAIWFAFNMD